MLIVLVWLVWFGVWFDCKTWFCVGFSFVFSLWCLCLIVGLFALSVCLIGLVYLVLWDLEIGLYCFDDSGAVVVVTISVVWLVMLVLPLLV